MKEIPWGTKGYFVVPLITTSSGAGFLDGPTLAAGDAKLWTDEQVLTNLGTYSAPFTAGRTKPEPGDEIYIAGASSQVATVVAVVHSSGSFTSTDAAGQLYAFNLTTGFSSGVVGITGGTSAAMTLSTDLSSGLIAEVDAGHVAVPYTTAESACKQGFFVVEDQTATKEWLDQSIPFITIGHPKAGNPYKAIPIPAGELSTVASGSGMGVSSSVASIPSTGAWNGGVLHVVKDGMDAHGEPGMLVIDSSSDGALVLDPGFLNAPSCGYGAYLQPAAVQPATSGANLPKVDVFQINESIITGIGASSDPWDGNG